MQFIPHHAPFFTARPVPGTNLSIMLQGRVPRDRLGRTQPRPRVAIASYSWSTPTDWGNKIHHVKLVRRIRNGPIMWNHWVMEIPGYTYRLYRPMGP